MASCRNVHAVQIKVLLPDKIRRISVINPSIERPEEMEEGETRERDLIDPHQGSLDRTFQM